MPISIWGDWVKGKRANGFPPKQAATGGDVRPPPTRQPTSDSDELRLVTALFADIVGSTTLGEFLAMEEVKALVGECVSRMCEVIEKYGGTVGAYMGDGVAAFFGLETADERDQYRAALAALEVRDVVTEYAREAKSAWGVDNLNVRIGINCGRVATGTVGAKEPRVVALGDAVNVAARLQAVADPGSIVVGRSIAQSLAGQFELQDIGPIELRGRSKPADAYLLIAHTPIRSNDVARAIVGREDELERMETRLSELSAGRGQIVLILGDAGVGKTRLLEEARRRATSDILWLGAGSSPLERRVPYAPFVEVLRGWLGLGSGMPDIAIRVRLQARLGQLFGEVGHELVAPLARLLGVPPRTKADRRLDGLPVEVLRASLHRAYRDWLVGLARTVPVVVAVDNFGRVDEATAQLGEDMLAITDIAPVLLVATMRADAGALGWRLRVKAHSEYSHRTDELRLQALSDADALSLVSTLDATDALTDGVKSALVRTAEGNPLYLEELFNAVTGAGSEGERRPEPALVLPPALESLLMSRIDRLPAGARDLLQAAAVLGREFSRRALQVMKPVEDFDDVLSALLRADLIRERRREPAEYAFKHGLLREAALSTLTTHRRRELHGKAAIAIESTSGPNFRENVPDLAWHYVTSGDIVKGAKFLEDLGERLVALYHYDQALEVLDECRAYLGEKGSTEGHSRVTEKLAELRARTGDSVGASALLDELAGARTDTDANRLLAIKAQIAVDGGRLGEAEALLRECLNGPLDSDLEQKALVLSAHVALRSQDLSATRSFLERVGNVDELAGDGGFDASSVWAGYLAASGDFAAARAWAERTLFFAQRSGRISAELRAQRQLGVLDLLNGRVRPGHDLLRKVFDGCTGLSFSIGALESGVNLVHAACLLGELVEAEDVSVQMLSLAQSPFWEALAQSNLATIRFEMNDLRAAEAAAKRVLSLGAEATMLAPRIAARAVLSKVHAAMSDWLLAEEELRLAGEETKDMAGRQGLLMAVRTASGELGLMRGDRERALSEAEEGLESLAYVEKPMHLALLRLKGMALAGIDPARATAILHEVLKMSRAMEMKLEEARTLIAIGAFENASFVAFEEAETIFRRCRCERGLIELSQARGELLKA